MTTHFLGKALSCVVSLEINPKFKPITVVDPLIELKEDVIGDLSTDQKYGYVMVNAIRTGVLSVDLANMDIGPVNHSRWLTTANRFMRLYVSKHGFKGKNLTNLKLIVEFIVGVYYTLWFKDQLGTATVKQYCKPSSAVRIGKRGCLQLRRSQSSGKETTQET